MSIYVALQIGWHDHFIKQHFPAQHNSKEVIFTLICMKSSSTPPFLPSLCHACCAEYTNSKGLGNMHFKVREI